MNTKKNYTSPQVEVIQLDSDISLILQSEPPIGPNEFSFNSDIIDTHNQNVII